MNESNGTGTTPMFEIDNLHAEIDGKEILKGVDLTVSSYSSYVSFLEGYARALATVETRWERASTWLTETITVTRPELRFETGGLGRNGGRRLLQAAHATRRCPTVQFTSLVSPLVRERLRGNAHSTRLRWQ